MSQFCVLPYEKALSISTKAFDISLLTYNEIPAYKAKQQLR